MSQSILANDSTILCLRCQLIEHFIEHNIDDLNGFILQSLCLLSFKSGIDPQPLISPAANAEAVTEAKSDREGSARGKAKLFDSLTLPQQATKLFLQHTNSLPKVYGFNQSGQLLFLHARSLLTERSSTEILDYTLSAFRHFDKFCSGCTEKLYSSSSVSDLHTNTSSHRKKVRRIKFRLFNIDTQQQTSSHHHKSADGGSEVATDVVASLKSSSLTEASSSLLHENIGSSLFGGDGFEPIEPFSFGLGEEFESNLIEPLFQLLIEVFELKGTMIRTFRRTVMFGFRLVFGQTLLSKQMKMSLEHFFTDANILQMIATLHETVHGWNDNVEKNNSENGVSKGMAAASVSSNSKSRHRRSASNQSQQHISKSESKNMTSTSAYLSDLNELLDSFSPLLDSSTADLNPSSETIAQPGNEHTNQTRTATPPANSNAQSSTDDINQLNEENSSDNKFTTKKVDHNDAANIARLQILAKQLLFASVPSFLNHLFGTENTITGLNKSFDILQYQKLNKQLVYVSYFCYLVTNLIKLV